jgi:hypothetical protein
MENSPQIVINLSANWQIFAIVAVTLLAYGILFNELVNWLGERQEGYTSWLVVIGVFVTLTGYAIVAGIGHALLVAGLFIASGFPMIAGEFIRVVRKRNQLRGEMEKKTWNTHNAHDSES